MQVLHLNSLEWHDRFTYRKNILFDETTLRQKGAKFQIVRFAPNTRVDAHAHEHVCEVFYILDGEGTFTFNAVAHQATTGTVFLCEPGDSHAIENTGTGELIILIFKTNEDPEDIHWF